MHEDMTEHQWQRLLVVEQGEELCAWTYCPSCGLSAWDLLRDQIARTFQEVQEDTSDTTIDTPRPPILVVSPDLRAANAFNLMFSGVGLDLPPAAECE